MQETEQFLTRRILRRFTIFGLFVGNVINTGVLFIFYYTIFALSALFFFSRKKILSPVSVSSNWRTGKGRYSNMECFRDEY